MKHKAQLQHGETLLVVECGGVGLSAVMIGMALGAQVIAVDINNAALAKAARLGALHTVRKPPLSESSPWPRMDGTCR